MRLRTRFTALMVVLMVVTVLVTTTAMAVNTRSRLIEQAVREAKVLAEVVTQSARTAWFVPDSVEDIVSDLMVTQAKLTARYVQAAERAEMSADDISYALTDITFSSRVGEFWVTDEKGHAYINSADEEFTFSPDPGVQPQAHIFWPLLTGGRDIVVGEVKPRDSDKQKYKYVGVTGFDKPRIVQVGYAANFFEEVARRVGLDRTIEGFISLERLQAVWVYDSDLTAVAFKQVEQEAGAPTGRNPGDKDMAAVRETLEKGRLVVVEGDDWLSVSAPILDNLGATVGATLIHISLQSLSDILKEATLTAFEVALAMLAVGGLVSLAIAGRFTRPIEAISVAAGAVERDCFTPDLLGGIPERKDELGNLGRTVQRMAGTLQQREEELAEMVFQRTAQLEQKARALSDANAQIAEELRIAQTLQTAILPEESLRQSDFEVQAVMRPARIVGGDFYDYMQTEDSRIGVVVADVSGKGVPAAFFMAVARTTLHALATSGDSPSDVMFRANNVLCSVNPMGLFVTVFYAILDRRSGDLTYVNAGHNPPCLVSKDGKVEFLPTTGGVALGVMPDLEYSEARVTLAPGDMIFAYTDGFTEAFDGEGREFGEGRLIEALAGAAGRPPQNAQSLSETATEAVRGFVGEAEQSDDLTSLTLHYVGQEGALEVITNRELIVHLRNDMNEVPRLLEGVEQLGALASLPPKAVFETNLVLDEIIANIVNYAYEDDGEHWIIVEIVVGSDYMRLTVVDDGKPFNPLIEVDAPDLEVALEDRKIGGLGVHFMKSLMEDITYSWQEGRNRLMMKKRLVRDA